MSLKLLLRLTINKIIKAETAGRILRLPWADNRPERQICQIWGKIMPMLIQEITMPLEFNTFKTLLLVR